MPIENSKYKMEADHVYLSIIVGIMRFFSSSTIILAISYCSLVFASPMADIHGRSSTIYATSGQESRGNRDGKRESDSLGTCGNRDWKRELNINTDREDKASLESDQPSPK